MLTLAKTELNVMTQQRMIRLRNDIVALRTLSNPEIRAVYSELEALRDELSKLLDRADGKRF
jgi:hypothetical protein